MKGKRQEEFQIPHKTTSTCQHSPNILMPDLEDIEDITDSKLDQFIDPVTPEQELPFNKFRITQLTVWPNQDFWRHYRWTTWS